MLNIITGILALVWPGITLIVLIVLLGIDVLLFGIGLLMGSFAGTGSGVARTLLAVAGLFAVLAGASLFLRPLRNIGTIAAVIAVFWVVGGVAEVVSNLFERQGHWIWGILSGLVGLVAGIIAISWPGITLLALAITAGVWMLLTGVTRLFIGLALRTTA